MVITLNSRTKDIVSKQQIEALKKVPTATIGHVLDQEFMDNELWPLSRDFSFCGPAITVRCFGSDSAIVHYAVDAAEEGDVIVVDRMGDNRYACWGGGVSLAAKTQGVVGAIVDGKLTDRIEIEETKFHVFGRGLSPVTTRTPGESGEINVPVTCGGVIVNPGDIILADDDGILVLPPSRVQEVLEIIAPRLAREPLKREAIHRGESLAVRSGAKANLEANLAKQSTIELDQNSATE